VTRRRFPRIIINAEADVIAQAVLEKGVLDSLSWTVANVADAVGSAFQQRPWTIAVVAIIIILLLVRRK
jgi:hypothetical protein